MRTVDAPTEATAFGRSEENVFLGVVEVFARESRRVLAKGRLGGGLAVGLERPKVLLGAGHESGMSDALGIFECGEEVTSHASVDADIFGLGGLAQPGAEEYVRRIDARKRVSHGGLVPQVSGDRNDSVGC